MKYKIELWKEMVKQEEFETDHFEEAKQQYIEWRTEYDESVLGSTDFQIDGVSMNLEWKYEHLLGLNFNEIVEEQKKKINEMLKEIHAK
ncbi:hypothetical protein [Petroclostridium sp. X23]|uniref:hypothetical protein n=1 Tax=Petroclostridium sp. X23 TaxID=3045146 RepID=UPI0024AD98BF|nr:hypothetical protein [Petroclostridium sp. X23]WHH59141.1 hypothetical protein QKW49_25705 [Petroclostridium sp. X23]